ncbi:DNA metabolism protein [Antarcticibacterium arcticum]|uniref:DNA metabolism protein n=1 Tax=Antarcticibacterium arcticum TaxID=2585771 RepID=A0A5B8YJ52_9FLAO|nr:TIGR03915 family putative DNA repair protein [Antarcticibacterium arcticum]QED37972.1 DNA metabolism protein [Antarcticibacterium arcticum]
MKNTILIYDGSFEGFLTCVFQAFEQRLNVTGIYTEEAAQPGLFSTPEIVITNFEKAGRVKKGLKDNLDGGGRRQLYFSFLSELSGIELQLLEYIKLVFARNNFSSRDFGNPLILRISQTAKMVSREKHRMEAFVRFMLTKDEIYFAHIEPDFNVLPLILPHFESRYADQKWIIYDLKRKFGLFYNLHETNYISMDISPDIFDKNYQTSVYSTSELEFQELWRQYFKSTNIKSRKNLKLHNQHVPKRYWKYLSEKSSLHN